MRDSSLFFIHWHFLEIHLCTVECTNTLKLSMNPTVLYFVVVYVLLAKGIVHNDHSLCFYTCVFEIIWC